MKTHKVLKIFGVLLLVAFLYSCQKQPNASFVLDKAEYHAGETVQLTNTSSDADHYEWTLPGGHIVTEVNTTYIIADTAVDIISFKLTAFSKDGKLSDVATKSINVIPKLGNAVFWQSEIYDNIVVDIYGVVENIINKINEEPTCGNSDCANFSNLVIGTHKYKANDGTHYWEGYIVVSENACTITKLSLANATTLND